MIASWCDDVGIKLRLDQMDEGAFGDEVYDNADDDMFIWSWRGDIDPGFMLSTFTTTQILNWGDSQYSDPEYDALLRAQAEALDPAGPTTPRRAGVTDQMQPILYRDTPYVILWYNMNLQAFRTDKWTGYGTGADQGAGRRSSTSRVTPTWTSGRGPPASRRRRAPSSWVDVLVAGAVVAVAVVMVTCVVGESVEDA